jgi:mono/diheme cytochrome c family protein
MAYGIGRLRRCFRGVLGFIAVTVFCVGGAAAQDAALDRDPKLVVPMIDVGKGKRLFVERGCILCHSVNKVGGIAGPPLDAPKGGGPVDLLDFMARMWRGAFAMIELQGMELGYQLDFSGEDLGHIAAFLADRNAQERFSERDVPDLIQDMFIREPFDLTTGLKAPGER